MSIAEAKKEYNLQLDRYYKAEKYFENDKISQEEKEKYLPHFQEVLKNLNNLLDKIVIYKECEILNGFKGAN